MDAVIFNLGILGLYFVQFLSFILYFDTDSYRQMDNICIKFLIQDLQGWEKFMLVWPWPTFGRLRLGLAIIFKPKWGFSDDQIIESK